VLKSDKHAERRGKVEIVQSTHDNEVHAAVSVITLQPAELLSVEGKGFSNLAGLPVKQFFDWCDDRRLELV
jgi:hypothetical protein